MVVYKVSATEDYSPLMDLFLRNEVEVSIEELPTIIKAWRVTVGEKNQLIGGVSLAKRQGEFVINGIAIEPEYRDHKIGKILLEKAVEEVRALGGPKILLVARAPGFFKKSGFVETEDPEAMKLFHCEGCSQLNVSCHPEILELELELDPEPEI